jgi:hypothetical protein
MGFTLTGRFLVWGATLLASVASCGPISTTSRADTQATCKPWKVVPSTRVAGILFGGAGVAPSDTWAVGATNFLELLLEHWDGRSWTRHTLPGTGGLEAAAAVSEEDVWAVGDDSSSGDDQTLTAHWDGTLWTVIPSPTPGGGGLLHSVSAVSANDVWAAGEHDASNGTVQPLFLHWDGTAWTVVPAPHGTELSGGIINGIHALSATDVWAVGYKGTLSITDYLPLTEHWDGLRWRIVPISPPSTRGANILRAVSGTATDDMWAVGSKTDGHFIEHWDGSNWTLTEDITDGSLLWGVTAISNEDAWAVGSPAASYALIKHWDGTSWSKVTSPPAGIESSLKSVWANGPNDIWAVGFDYPVDLSRYSTLAEHSSEPC